MTVPAVIERNTPAKSVSIKSLVEHAASTLAKATNAADILDARDQASFIYTAAKKAARLSKAKKAHDDLVKAAYRVQADALDIEAQAKRRLADEYDLAKRNDEVRTVRNQDRDDVPRLRDLGMTKHGIHKARQVRDAERRSPGIVRRTLDAEIDAGREPTRASVARAISQERKERAEHRHDVHNAIRQKASEARSLAKVTNAEIALLKRGKNFGAAVNAVRKAGETWIELADRMERY